MCSGPASSPRGNLAPPEMLFPAAKVWKRLEAWTSSGCHVLFCDFFGICLVCFALFWKTSCYVFFMFFFRYCWCVSEDWLKVTTSHNPDKGRNLVCGSQHHALSSSAKEPQKVCCTDSHAACRLKILFRAIPIFESCKWMGEIWWNHIRRITSIHFSEKDIPTVFQFIDPTAAFRRWHQPPTAAGLPGTQQTRTGPLWLLLQVPSNKGHASQRLAVHGLETSWNCLKQKWCYSMLFQSNQNPSLWAS